MDINKDFDAIVEANKDMFQGAGDCPMGDDCAIHFRNNERHMDEENEYGRYITYVGEYAVITGDSPLSAEQVLGALAGIATGVAPELGDDYQTTVEYIGKDNALVVLNEMTDEEYSKTLRYRKTFGDFSNFENDHEYVVYMVTEGLLDLSKPVE